MYRQQILQLFKENYFGQTLVFDIPFSSHISDSCYGNLHFYYFFRLRKYDECVSLIKDMKRKSQSAQYYEIIQNMILNDGKFNKSIAYSNIVLKPTYCMPWKLKCNKLQYLPFVCRPKSFDPDLPFFFKYFDIHSNIKFIAHAFLEEYNLDDFITYHYRAGDHKTLHVPSYRPLNCTLNYVKNFSQEHNFLRKTYKF